MSSQSFRSLQYIVIMRKHIFKFLSLFLTTFFLIGCQATSTAEPPAFSDIQIDVSPLQNNGYSQWANIIKRSATAEARSVFYNKNRQGNRLTIRFTHVSLGMYAGISSSARRGEDSMDSINDYINVEAIISDSKGRVIRNYPQLSTLPASRAGAWYAQNNETKRLEALARNSVQWLGRKL